MVIMSSRVILDQERSKYLEVDEEEVLEGLSDLEIQQLALDLEDLDPDNQLLPAGLRQRNQTDKNPTGPLDRDQLLNYIEEESKQVEDKEDIVPYQSGVKRGKVFKAGDQLDSFDPTTPTLASLDPELEECLNTASEAELTDIAAILGMHQILNNDQYYSSYKSSETIVNKTGMSSTTKCELVATVASEPPNPTNVEETLKKLQDNDPDVTEVNLNNIKNIPIHTLQQYCEALKKNTFVKSWSLANTRSNDTVATAIADMLEANIGLKVLNVESNFMSCEGIMAIVETLRENVSLEQLRIDNQRALFGSKVESEICDVLKVNQSLLKLGYHFHSQGPRNNASSYLTRNGDLRRKRRFEQAQN